MCLGAVVVFLEYSEYRDGFFSFRCCYCWCCWWQVEEGETELIKLRKFSHFPLHLVISGWCEHLGSYTKYCEILQNFTVLSKQTKKNLNCRQLQFQWHLSLFLDIIEYWPIALTLCTIIEHKNNTNNNRKISARNSHLCISICFAGNRVNCKAQQQPKQHSFHLRR